MRFGINLFPLAFAVRASLSFVLGNYHYPEGPEVINIGEQSGVCLRYVGLFSVVAIVILVPWAAPNQLVQGRPILGPSNLGVELMISNNDLANAEYFNNEVHGLFNRYHPFLEPAARAYAISHGEAVVEKTVHAGRKTVDRFPSAEVRSTHGPKIRSFLVPKDEARPADYRYGS